jgi:hypothetical protein
LFIESVYSIGSVAHGKEAVPDFTHWRARRKRLKKLLLITLPLNGEGGWNPEAMIAQLMS